MQAEDPSLSLNILVIDDDPAICQMIVWVFQLEDWQTRVANSGEEGIAAATSARFDLIVLDIDLPDTNGWQVLQALRDRLQDRRPPVLVISGDEQRIRDLRTYQPEAHIRKPFDVDDLVQAIRQLTQS